MNQLYTSFITPRSEPGYYQIKVKGQLDQNWSEWFDGLSVIPEPDGDTVIYGPVTDQAALFGILEKVNALGLTLISACRVEKSEEGAIKET